MLAALVARDGGVVEAHLRLGDDPATIRDALRAPGADVILVSGGSSVGSEDHAPHALAEVGELAIHGVAMRPSSPAGVGLLGDALVFLLPGNPVSCLCAYDFFAGRAIRLRGGRAADWPHRTRRRRVARKIVSAIGRVDYCRVRWSTATSSRWRRAGRRSCRRRRAPTASSSCRRRAKGYGAGAEVTVYLYD